MPDSAARKNQRLRDRIAVLDNELACTRQTFIDAIPIAIGIFDDQCRFLAVNQTLAAIHGIAPAEHDGRTASEMVPFLVDMVQESVTPVLRTRTAICEQELSSGNPPSAPPSRGLVPRLLPAAIARSPPWS